LEVLHANLLQNIGELTAVENLFQNALEANPELAGVWCDLGKHYHYNYKHVEAWQCYAAARSIAPRHFLLKEILDLETKLRQDFADYL
jgi:cytochrome c-type biogenesis protein CcmH/NrfG